MNTEDFEKLQAQAYAEVLELFSYDANEVDKWLLERVRGLSYMTPKEALQSEDAYSRPRLSLTPDEACHPFHTKAATDSTAKLPSRQAA